jgi:anti-sigma factor RsiW
MSDDAHDMTCQEVVELVTDYLSGALGEADRARFESHLTICAPCVVHLEQMRTTVALTGRLDAGELDEHVKRELMDAFRRWKL